MFSKILSYFKIEEAQMQLVAGEAKDDAQIWHASAQAFDISEDTIGGFEFTIQMNVNADHKERWKENQ